MKRLFWKGIFVLIMGVAAQVPMNPQPAAAEVHCYCVYNDGFLDCFDWGPLICGEGNWACTLGGACEEDEWSVCCAS